MRQPPLDVGRATLPSRPEQFQLRGAAEPRSRIPADRIANGGGDREELSFQIVLVVEGRTRTRVDRLRAGARHDVRDTSPLSCPSQQSRGSHLRRLGLVLTGRPSERLPVHELGIQLTDKAKDAIGQAGWDPQFGARPLKRAIQRLLEDPLAKKVLGGEFPPGTTITVDANPQGELTFGTRMQN